MNSAVRWIIDSLQMETVQVFVRVKGLENLNEIEDVNEIKDGLTPERKAKVAAFLKALCPLVYHPHKKWLGPTLPKISELSLAFPWLSMNAAVDLQFALDRALGLKQFFPTKLAELEANQAYVSKADKIRLALLLFTLPPAQLRDVLKAYGIEVTTKNIRDVKARLKTMKNEISPHHRS